MKLNELFDTAHVAQLDLSPPCTVPTGTPVHAAIDEMKAAHHSVIVIVNGDGEVAGIFTEVDIVRKVLGHRVAPDAAIDQYMTSDPQTIMRDGELSAAFDLMGRRNFRHLPVVDSENKPIGLLAVRDLIRYIAERYPAEVLAMAPDVHQVVRADGG